MRDFHGFRNPVLKQDQHVLRGAMKRAGRPCVRGSHEPVHPPALAGMRVTLARVSGRKETVKSNACPSEVDSVQRPATGVKAGPEGEQGWEKNLRA